MRRAPAASLLLVALLVAACGSSTPSGGTGSTPGTSAGVSNSASASAAPATGAPSGTKAPASSSPSDSAQTSADPTPTADSSSAIPSDSATPSPSASHAALACQPEGTSRTFWSAMAQQVSWDVYCAVLPKGWQVGDGGFRLAGGGWMTISYNGPSGASISLSEGSFCKDGSGCVPSGSDAGDASFGAMSGTLVKTDAGGYAIVVARGESPSWLLISSGLDQATTISFGAALARVSG
jgi:hypothetical protein